MEKAPLVSDLEVAVSDEEEEQAAHQPVRSRTMRRAGIALMVLGLVGAVLLVGTVHDQMVVANVGNAEAKFGFGNMWDKVKSAATTVKDHASNVDLDLGAHANNLVNSVKEQADAHANNLINTVKDHAENLDVGAHANNLVNSVKEQADAVKEQADAHANNLINTVKGHADNLAAFGNTVKSHASNIQKSAADAMKAPVCAAIKLDLPKLKLRWADKMAADLLDDKAACYKDVKSEECAQSFVDDACPMEEGVRSLLCDAIFKDVVSQIQAHIPQIVGAKTSAPWTNALNMEMPLLDAKVEEFCK